MKTMYKREYKCHPCILGKHLDFTQTFLTSNLPRFGFSFPANTFNAVDLPIPLVPTKPKTCPGLGTGNLKGNQALHQEKYAPLHIFNLITQRKGNNTTRRLKVNDCKIREKRMGENMIDNKRQILTYTSASLSIQLHQLQYTHV